MNSVRSEHVIDSISSSFAIVARRTRWRFMTLVCLTLSTMMRQYTLLLVLLMLTVQSDAFTSSNTFMSSRLGAQSPSLVHSATRPPSSSSELSALLDPSVVTSVLTQDSIHDAFSVATFFPQPFWLLLVLLPNTGLTKKLMGGMGTFVL